MPGETIAELKFPTSLTIDEDSLVVDGVRIAFIIIPQILYELAHPDPRKWYRLERTADTITVHVKITEDTDGHIIASTADAERSGENSGQQGQGTSPP